MEDGRGLTARTRNNEVLPAFWRPIMVISISVALDRTTSILTLDVDVGDEVDGVGCALTRRASVTSRTHA